MTDISLDLGSALLASGFLVLAGIGTLQILLHCRQARKIRELMDGPAADRRNPAPQLEGSRDTAPPLQSRLDDAMERIQKLVVRAEQASPANSGIVPKLSNELRTPLSAIIGFAEMMEQQALGPIGNKKYREYVVGIRKSGKQLLGVVDDLVDLSHIESGKELIREQLIAPGDVVGAVHLAQEEAAREAAIELLIDCPDELPTIRADKCRLTQILDNLLSNAIQFSPAGGKVSLHCWATESSGFVFQVVDSGIGIAREDIPRALSVFGQIDNDQGRQPQGSGLGLPLAKALAELHGGTLDLQSELGKGTTVTLRLPAYRIVAGGAAPAVQNQIAI